MKEDTLNLFGDQQQVSVSIDDQIKCVERELAFRRRVYERRIGLGKMTRSTANREIESMEAVKATLEGVRDGQ